MQVKSYIYSVVSGGVLEVIGGVSEREVESECIRALSTSVKSSLQILADERYNVIGLVHRLFRLLRSVGRYEKYLILV